MQFYITKQFGRSAEQKVGQFNERVKAQQFMEAKLSEDARMKVSTTYRLYNDLDDLCEEQKADSWVSLSSESTDSSASQRGTGPTFSPTPLPTSPRPPGMPASVFKKEDPKDQDKSG